MGNITSAMSESPLISYLVSESIDHISTMRRVEYYCQKGTAWGLEHWSSFGVSFPARGVSGYCWLKSMVLHCQHKARNHLQEISGLAGG